MLLRSAITGSASEYLYSHQVDFQSKVTLLPSMQGTEEEPGMHCRVWNTRSDSTLSTAKVQTSRPLKRRFPGIMMHEFPLVVIIAGPNAEWQTCWILQSLGVGNIPHGKLKNHRSDLSISIFGLTPSILDAHAGWLAEGS